MVVFQPLESCIFFFGINSFPCSPIRCNTVRCQLGLCRITVSCGNTLVRENKWVGGHIVAGGLSGNVEVLQWDGGVEVVI